MGLVELESRFDDLCVRFPRFGFWILTEQAQQELYGDLGVQLMNALDECKRCHVAPPHSETDTIQKEMNAKYDAAKKRFDDLLQAYHPGAIESYFRKQAQNLDDNCRLNMGHFHHASYI